MITRFNTLALLIIVLTTMSNSAQAGLIFTIESLTTEEFKFNVTGTLDADTTGNLPYYLSISNNWTLAGGHQEWLNNALNITIAASAFSVNGVSGGTTTVMPDTTTFWGDSVYVNTSPHKLVKDDTINWSVWLKGSTGAFDVTAFNTLNLVSGWNASINNYTRLEAKATNPVSSVPEPTTLAIFALGMMGLASRRLKKSS